MDINTAQQIEATMKQLVMQNNEQVMQAFMQALSEDGITQDEVDEFRAMTIEAIDNPRMYPRYMKYLESNGLMDVDEIPDVYDAGFLFAMLGLAGVAQDAVNG